MVEEVKFEGKLPSPHPFLFFGFLLLKEVDNNVTVIFFCLFLKEDNNGVVVIFFFSFAAKKHCFFPNITPLYLG